MSVLELFILAVGLSMDAFAVAVCKGLATPKLKLRHCIIVGLWFGAFQVLMPLLGYLLGTSFASLITQIDHWVAFVLLVFIGGNMIKESFSTEPDCSDASLAPRTMFLLAVATSIDALAVGITFAFLKVDIIKSILIIGITTFIISMIGVIIGNNFGNKYEKKAELAGGIILIFIGLKILLEHLGII